MNSPARRSRPKYTFSSLVAAHGAVEAPTIDNEESHALTAEELTTPPAAHRAHARPPSSSNRCCVLSVALAALGIVACWLGKAALSSLYRDPVHDMSHTESMVADVQHGAAVQYARVPCVPPHCYFECYQPPPGVNLSCQVPRFDWVKQWPPRTCHTPSGDPTKFYPISFAIPASEVVGCVPRKVKDFAAVVPGDKSTYIFRSTDEAEYKRDYRMARFGYTMKKAGWDCTRHYEILASGSVPYFVDLEAAVPSVMTSLPKDLLLSAKGLPGVTQHGVNHQDFDEIAYHELACQLLEYTRSYLTTEHLAEYVLRASGHADAKRVLFLSENQETDNQRCDVLHGLRELLSKREGVVVVDYPRIDHMYYMSQDHPVMKPRDRVGLGMGYTFAYRMSEELGIDRDPASIRAQIAAQWFDVVIYGSVHRGTPFLDEVAAHYSPEKIVFIDGEDWQGWKKVRGLWKKDGSMVLGHGYYFMREMPPGCPWP